MSAVVESVTVPVVSFATMAMLVGAVVLTTPSVSAIVSVTATSMSNARVSVTSTVMSSPSGTIAGVAEMLAAGAEPLSM